MDCSMGYTTRLFDHFDAQDLIREYGSPLYVYDEKILRTRCQEMKNLLQYPHFRVNYSAKANTNVELLKIICSEGLDVDAMSPGEMYLELKAGFTADHIMFIGNNVSAEEIKFAVERGILVSVDSLSQLETLCSVNPGGEVCLRINPEIGAGHHEKVVTAGKKAKFGIAISDLPQAKAITAAANVNIVGLNQHIGSLFLEPEAYVEAAGRMLEVAATIPGLKMIDLGGGFGVPYRHDEEPRLDLKALGQMLDSLITSWTREHWPLIVRIEPGRYIPCECGAILGTVHSLKNNFNTIFIGTDVGFNVLARPVMYDSYHEID
ncbi:MAG: diaminopimelate decarboxylase, partial [Methylocystaceae bacterium]